jgi:hypothetical protein
MVGVVGSSLHHRLELSDISQPWLPHQVVDNLARQLTYTYLFSRPHERQRGFTKIRDILTSLPKRGEMNHIMRQTVIEIPTKLSRRERLIEWAIHRSKESTIDPPERVRANRTNSSLLNDIQEPYLNIMRELIKLIQKERPLMSLNRETSTRLDRSGKRPLDVSE